MKQKIILLISFLFLAAGNANANWVVGNVGTAPSSPIPACSTLTTSATFSWVSFSSFLNDNHLMRLDVAFPTSSVDVASGTPSLQLNSTPYPSAIFTQVGQTWECTFPAGTVFPAGAVLTFEVAGVDIVDTPGFTNQPLAFNVTFIAAPAGEVFTDNSASTTFDTTPTPPVTANSTATTIVQGQQITLTGGGAVSYAWDSASVMDGVAFTPPLGTHIYTVTGTDANACTATSSITITVNQANGNWVASGASTAPSSPIPACSTLTVSGNYSWLSFDPYINDVHQATISSSLPISAIVTANTVPVLKDLANNVILGTNFTQTANGFDCTFDPGITFPAGYQFIFEISGLDIVDTPAYSNQTVMDSISFVSPANGESFTDNSNTIVYSTLAAPVLNLTASPSTTVCMGDTVTIMSGAVGATSYTWNGSPGSIDTVLAPAVSGTYTIVATDANSGCTATDSIEVIVNMYPAFATTATPDTVCSGDSVQLNTTPQYTNNYILSSVAFAPTIPTGTVDTLAHDGTAIAPLTTGSLDDGRWNSISLPFSFDYYGNSYTDFSVSTNGFLSFTPLTTNFANVGMPSTNNPNAYIALASEDLDMDGSPGPGGTLDYFTEGTAPNRKFVLRFTNVDYWSGAATDPPVTTELVLNETSNTIEMHVTNVSPIAVNGTTMGIEGPAGALATVIPGRNDQAPFAALNEGWLFTPPTNPGNTVWSPAGTLSDPNVPNPIANPIATTNYIVNVTQNGCTTTDSVEVFVNPLPTLTASATPATAICPGDTAMLSATGAVTYVWEPGTLSGANQSVTPMTTTTYTVSGTDAIGCVGTATTVVTVNPIVPLTVVVDSNETCPGDMNGGATATSPGLDVQIFAEGFETYTGVADTFGLTPATPYTMPGLTSGTWTYETSTAQGRMSIPSQGGAAYVRTGNNSVSLDASVNSASPDPINLLSVEVDLSAYAAATDLTFSFWFRDVGDEVDPNDSVWIRGANTDPWIGIGGWNTLGGTSGFAQASFDLDALITAAGQTLTATAGMRWGQEDNFSMTSDGFVLDDVEITQPSNNSLLWSTSDTTNSITGLGAGTYTVTATDVNGCSTTDSAVISALAVPTLALSASPSATVCTGETVTLMSGAVGSDSLTWNGVATAGLDTVLAPAAAGTYIAWAIDTMTGCSTTDSIMVVVNTPLPMDSIVASTATVCSGDTVTIQAYPGVIPPSTYCTASASCDESVDSVSFNTINNATSCSGGYSDQTAISTNLTVGTSYPISVTTNSFYSGDQCAVWVDWNQDNTFDTGSEEYLLTGGPTFTGSIPVPAGAFNGNTRMRIRMTYTGVNGPCGSQSWGETEDYTVNVSGGTVAPPPAAGFASISWMPTSVTPTTGATVSAQGLTTMTTFIATGIDTNGCESIDSATVMINQLPVITATVAPTMIICPGDTAMLSASGANTYVWEPGALAGANQSVTPAATTTYTVSGTDANGCVGTAAVVADVHPAQNLVVTVDSLESCFGTMNGGATATSPGAPVVLFYEGFESYNGVADTFGLTAATPYTLPGLTTGTWTYETSTAQGRMSIPSQGGAAYVRTGNNSVSLDASVNSASPDPINLLSVEVDLSAYAAATDLTFSFWFRDVGDEVDPNDSVWIRGANTDPWIGIGGWNTLGGTSGFAQASFDLDALITAAGQTLTATAGMRWGQEDNFSMISDGFVLDDIEITQPSINSLLWSTSDTTNSITGLGAGTYTVTSTDVNGCSVIDSAVLVQPTPSGDLTQAMTGNTASNPGVGCDTLMHPNDGGVYGYYDESCNIIASVQEPASGASLGSVISCATVDAAVPVYQNQPYVARHFEITPANQGPADVTLYFTDDDFADYNMARGSFDSIATNAGGNTTATICITQVSGGPLGTGTPTVHGPLTATWDATTMRWSVDFPVTGFSEFFCHTCNANNSALAVEYKSFTVTKQATSDLVEWTTENENQNSHFNVQRSTDGSRFVTLGKVGTKAPNGTSTGELNYSFVDAEPQIGHNYYRLEQVTADNNIGYTEVIDIIWGATGSVVTIYPNPATSEVNIDISTSNVSQTEVKLLDMSGRVVKSVMAKTIKGMNNIKLDLGNIANGVYGIQIFENNKLTHNSKLTKK